MISESQEVARYRIDEQLRAAEAHALRKECRRTRHPSRASRPRHELAGVLRRWADRLEPQQHQRRTGLSVVR